MFRHEHHLERAATHSICNDLQPECDELIHEARNVNYIDEAEYPSSTQIQNKCARTASHRPHVPRSADT